MPPKPNLIVDLTFSFSLKIIEYTEALEQKRKYNMANQLFKSGTSIGANVCESLHAESRKDFVHKIKIASKEAEETRYWLMLCERAAGYPNTDNLIHEVEAIQKVISKIISTTKNNISNTQ